MILRSDLFSITGRSVNIATVSTFLNFSNLMMKIIIIFYVLNLLLLLLGLDAERNMVFSRGRNVSCSTKNILSCSAQCSAELSTDCFGSIPCSGGGSTECEILTINDINDKILYNSHTLEDIVIMKSQGC